MNDPKIGGVSSISFHLESDRAKDFVNLTGYCRNNLVHVGIGAVTFFGSPDQFRQLAREMVEQVNAAEQ